MPPHSRTPNAFAPDFLDLMAERDEPPTAGEAETAGTAQVVPWGGGYAVLGEGFSLEEGDLPMAMLIDRSTALLVAAALPATGDEPIYQLGKEARTDGYPLYRHGRFAGHLAWYDENLVAALKHYDHLNCTPACLAQVLEAGGGLALERAGRLLERQTRRSPPPGEGPEETAAAADHLLTSSWLDGIRDSDRPAVLHLASCRICQRTARARLRPPAEEKG